ncbi:phage baseplate assembly protein V [Serratia fonticola]|uniref:phage baseplate assembly protein V n=1 Tax=Serratia fonticola TaxID=47917 RepID=UPI0016466B4A|nr:phage baseplate assembly protein V [Serratia fonticola]MBC3252866.1 phage baseplate assembly protein V [Serratia fonticola]
MSIKMIDERIGRFLSRVRQAFRGKVALVNTAGGIQTTQVNGLAGEDLPGVELFQHYGFTSAPPAGTTAVVIPIGGKTTHGIIVATEHGSYRLQGLENGEVALYTDEGASIVLKRGKIIEVTCDTYHVTCKSFNVDASEGATFTTPNLEASEQVTATGTINGNGGMAIKGGDGASFEGNVTQKSGSFTSAGKVIGSNLPDGHLHDTPDGRSGPPIKP